MRLVRPWLIPARGRRGLSFQPGGLWEANPGIEPAILPLTRKRTLTSPQHSAEMVML